MAAFMKLIQFLATKGKKYVSLAWKHKGTILKWINAGQSFEWIYKQIKKLWA
ncbi:aureocin A53 family class IId bacteriocin [Staphylococcus epidermidis]|uniref:aureocin A53 family class IId bacteriocin n=1 Tax=Staphylococcus epidermidis TaxID=1282 RepID=UPI00294AF8BE|nr:aureocin A53 family class IId bacteriocin [Staphylococcus epidermidis]